MLVTLNEILKIAEKRKCALGAFNTPNMASIRAVISAAEEKNEPVIIMHAQIHEEMKLCTIEEITPVMLFYAERAKVPVCVHLDHGEDIDYIKKGLELGYTSVMYDGSTLEDELNCQNTSLVVELAHRYGASVEGEIGYMGAREGGGIAGDSIYTDPAAAEKFAQNTGIDALSCAFGTVHGTYILQPNLDFERLAEINRRVNVPLVMHGGSGVSDEDFKKVIELGIRKINYYSYMAKAGSAAAAKASDMPYYHDVEMAAIEAMKQDVMNAINIFANKE